MTVNGTVTDSINGKPIPDARVSLSVMNSELAVLYTDGQGQFEHVDSSSYLGQTLLCRVVRTGYEEQEVTYQIDRDRIDLDIEMNSVAGEVGPTLHLWLGMGLGRRRLLMIVGTGAFFVLVGLVSLLMVAAKPDLADLGRFLLVYLLVAPIYMIVWAALIKGYLVPIANAVICAGWLLGITASTQSLGKSIGPSALFFLGYLVVGGTTTAIARLVYNRRNPAA